MKKSLIFLVIIIANYSCKTQFIEQEKTYIPNSSNEVVETKIMNIKSAYYFIRHAESNGNVATNPHLSKKGLDRLKLYIKFFADKKIDTVFTTNLNRTYETAKAVADYKKIPIVFYDPFKDSFKDFIKNHKNSPSLIVGHSNTTPDKVNEIIGLPKYSQMVEENYSDIFELIKSSDGSIVDVVLVLEDEVQRIEDSKLSPKELKRVLKQRKKHDKK